MEAVNNASVRQTIAEVFEHMAFLFGEPVDADELPVPESDCVSALVRFSGARSGALELLTVRELCPILAANVLGCEPEDEIARQRADDAMRELLNVLCGHLLTQLAGDQPVFDIAAGVVRDTTPEHFSALRDDPRSIAFLVEDLPVALRFSWEEAAS